MIYTNCRDAFIHAVIKVFKSCDAFLDFIENEEYGLLYYDCFYNSDAECYIINRSTGEYINWYKFTHIGRDIHSTVSPDKFEHFLQKFYDSRLWN
jgi:hypothetical protein